MNAPGGMVYYPDDNAVYRSYVVCAYRVWRVKDGVAGDFLNGANGRDVDFVHLHDRFDVEMVGRKYFAKARQDAGIVFERDNRAIGGLLLMGPDVGGFLVAEKAFNWSRIKSVSDNQTKIISKGRRLNTLRLKTFQQTRQNCKRTGVSGTSWLIHSRSSSTDFFEATLQNKFRFRLTKSFGTNK